MKSMKRLALALLLGLSTQALATTPPETPIDRSQIAPTPPAVPGGGCWRRTPSGSWVWIAPSTPNAQGAGGGGNIYVYVPNALKRARQRNFRPDTVNGIKWYLDGRSYFSD
jgi:hypothetical protein